MRKIVLICIITLIAFGVNAQNKKNMKETQGVATVAGNPLTLLGEPVIVGSIAPKFSATGAGGQEVKLSDFEGKIVVIAVFPSVDTGVCAAQTRKFNKEAAEYGDDVVVLTISKDLPFALSRFCAAEGLKNVHTLSDYKESEFGVKYGFLIKENKLLSRGVVILDKMGKVAYVEYVSDIKNEPNYEAAMKVVRELKK